MFGKLEKLLTIKQFLTTQSLGESISRRMELATTSCLASIIGWPAWSLKVGMPKVLYKILRLHEVVPPFRLT